MKGSETRRARTRLRMGIAAFVLAVAIPSALLVIKALDQIKWESFHQQQLGAEEFANRIDGALSALVRTEDSRPVSDYDFLTETATKRSAFARRSPLSELTARDGVPGLIGWFQVTADGGFTSPLLPASAEQASALGLTEFEIAARQAQADQIKGILIGNRLVERHERSTHTIAAARPPAPPTIEPEANRDEEASSSEISPTRRVASIDLNDKAESAPPAAPSPSSSAGLHERLSQAAFESLASAPLPESKRPSKYRSERANKNPKPKVEKDGASIDDLPSNVPAPSQAARELQSNLSGTGDRAPAAQGRSRTVRLFDSSVEPCEVGRLDSGHFLLFRSVWREGTRIIQGALIEQGPFLEQLIGRLFMSAALARNTHLQVVYRTTELASFRANVPRGYGSTPTPEHPTLLYRARMQEPFGGLELVFTSDRLPIPAGAKVIAWMAAALALVLLGGAWLMYRLGLSQIALVRQQQDFVSAVSHELKTPLTSIRLYAEMLRAGFASEERKATYYRFIHEESERLSRLIANVLQLARIGRDALVLDARPVALGELCRALTERVSEQVERSGFKLEMECNEGFWIQADPDAVIQILINLVDNALKFCSDAERRVIRVICESLDEQRLRISVRDYGPGIPRDQRRQLFQLFYRGDDAKKRAIPGTGIGLALVRNLTDAMGGQVEVLNKEPGTEFRVVLPLADAPPANRSPD